MSKYTLKDVIIDPEDPRLEDAIGKEVYYSDYPNACVRYANDNNRLFIDNLASIHAEDDSPFSVKNCFCTCIIVKKEDPKPESEYVPFKNVSEFIGAYRKVEAIQLKKENFYLSIRGIWIKYKATDTRLVVTEMWNNGLTIGSDTAVTSWNAVLKYYEFLDGTPCGKLKEADNA